MQSTTFESSSCKYVSFTLQLRLESQNFFLSFIFTGSETKMEEFWPAGDIYEGVGWAYLLNYLPIALLSKTAGGRGE